MIKQLIRKAFAVGQRRILGYESEVLTFSQAGEDLLIRNFFYERLSSGGKGFFVDIGAYHPYRHSNTYYLYRVGWRGINIDARPGSMELFRKLRPEDINLEVAIAENEGTANYYDFGTDAGLNTMSEAYIEKLGTGAKIQNVYEVSTMPLSKVFDTHLKNNNGIDFLSIDVEGFEEQALSTNDWTKHRPKLIAAEIYGFSLSDINSDPVSRVLTSNGYEIYARVNLAMPNVNTVFFVENEN